MKRIVVQLIAVLLLLTGNTVFAEKKFTEAERLFTLKVKPVFADKCNGCHGDDPDKIKGELDMLTLEKLLAGGETFGQEVLVPGDVKKSFLLDSIRWKDPDFEMPPKENDRLSKDQIANVEKWIKAGAPWPGDDIQNTIRVAESKRLVTGDGMIVKTSGGLGDDWTYRRYQPEDIWSFQPVVRPEVPDDASPNPLDAFVKDRLAQSGAEPAPPADAKTLVRRIYYDLIGLPPSPEEMNTWEKRLSADANVVGELADELLASPHFGERQAQHWLDVARYSDTGGMSNDYERSNMWRYRDYVIRAFNEDKPYNEFVVEQLAGDEIWEARSKGKRDSDLLVATGFLRMGPWDPAMVKQPQARQMYLDDVVNSVGQTFLSTTLRCVKCHDHKFDPIPTRDYYRVYAAFAGTQMAERPASFASKENREGFEAREIMTKQLLDFAKKQTGELVNKREAAARKWYEDNNLPYKNIEARKGDEDEMKPPRHVGLSPEEQGELKVREQDVWIWTRRMERYKPLVQGVYNGPDPKYLNARKLRTPKQIKGGAKLESHILLGGALEAAGDEVQPGVLSAIGVPVKGNEYVIDSKLKGRRLAFAKWAVNPSNPLTSRSMVNRIWQSHFGKPIAGNPNNFGSKGGKPTHPELLDWLAADFVENGWKMKRLHKLIVTSNTYQMGASHPGMEDLLKQDPNNNLLAYFPTRRLSAEELRDAMLRITGELNPDLGGLPVMPEINMEVALQPRMIQFSLAPAYQPSRTPEERNRRTIYAYRVRGQADPFLEVFNRPIPNDSCELRNSASVSPQAFTLMNSDVMTDRSVAFALRLQSDRETVPGQVRRGFQLAFGRNPSKSEAIKMVNYVTRMQEHHGELKPDQVDYPTSITRSLVEEFTGQPFEYKEILPAFEKYVPDLKPSDVKAETRALADFCLLLFNSNEFIYLY